MIQSKGGHPGVQVWNRAGFIDGRVPVINPQHGLHISTAGRQGVQRPNQVKARTRTLSLPITHAVYDGRVSCTIIVHHNQAFDIPGIGLAGEILYCHAGLLVLSVRWASDLEQAITDSLNPNPTDLSPGTATYPHGSLEWQTFGVSAACSDIDAYSEFDSALANSQFPHLPAANILLLTTKDHASHMVDPCVILTITEGWSDFHQEPGWLCGLPILPARLILLLKLSTKLTVRAELQGGLCSMPSLTNLGGYLRQSRKAP